MNNIKTHNDITLGGVITSTFFKLQHYGNNRVCIWDLFRNKMCFNNKSFVLRLMQKTTSIKSLNCVMKKSA